MASPDPDFVPYVDEPLLPPNRGGFNMTPRPGSVATSGDRDPSWDSRTGSMVDEHVLLSPRTPSLPPGAGHPYTPYVSSHGSPYADKELPGPAYVPAYPRKKSNRGRWFLIGVIALLVIAVVIGVVVYFAAVKPHQHNDNTAPGTGASSGNGSGDGSSANSTSPGGPANNVLISGGDGSIVTADDGTTFTYNNTFDGYWYFDPANPYSGAGKANSWTPASNESWQWGVDRIYGVNLGGWLVLEPFIVPSLYQKYQDIDTPAIDEWTLSEAMINDTSPGGGLNQIEDHYKTFITEYDFAQIASTGLNWVRIPVPFWMINKVSDGVTNEPFLEGVAWTYFLKAVSWARKYGLRINMDFHTIPGSQNGWNHSGKVGQINFMLGAMGLVNAQRTMDYLRIITEFISQDEYTNVVPQFGIMNEPRGGDGPGIENIKRFYYQTYTMMRNITGLGAGKGPVMSIFHAFAPNEWDNWLPNSDRIALDYHPYTIFEGGPLLNDPPATFADQPCNGWGSYVNDTSQNFGLITSGEFSAAINDCGFWINAANVNPRFEAQFGPGSCDTWNDYENWTPDVKAGMQTFVESQMDSLRDWFFWTWKIGPVLNGSIMAPMWSYSLGWQNGWIPEDPRTASGACVRAGFDQTDPFDGNYQPWQTGGPGGSLTPSTTEDYSWPPPTLASAPSYTPTGAITPLPSPTGDPESGWVDSGDTRGFYVAIPGCTYLDAWESENAGFPAPCGQ